MEPQVIASTPDDADALYAWWDGDALRENAQLKVQPDEVAVFVDGNVVVQEVGPGTHTLSAAQNPELKIYFVKGSGHSKSIEVCFVKTKEWPFEYHGLVDEEFPDGPSFNGTAWLKLESATQFVEAMLEVESTGYDEDGNSTVAEGEDPPTIDDWVADQLYAATSGAIKANLEMPQALARLNEALDQGGLKVLRFEIEREGAAPTAPSSATAPTQAATQGARFCGQCGAKQEGAGKFCGACGAPRA